jgi:homoserine acetyltransferase
LQVIQSEFGHDGFLIEIEEVSERLRALLQA